MMGLRWFFKEGGAIGDLGELGTLRSLGSLRTLETLETLKTLRALNNKGCAFGAAFVGVIWRMIILPSGVRAS